LKNVKADVPRLEPGEDRQEQTLKVIHLRSVVSHEKDTQKKLPGSAWIKGPVEWLNIARAKIGTQPLIRSARQSWCFFTSGQSLQSGAVAPL
jgi:hypothetical protein